jgi:hypothetical protein
VRGRPAATRLVVHLSHLRVAHEGHAAAAVAWVILWFPRIRDLHVVVRGAAGGAGFFAGLPLPAIDICTLALQGLESARTLPAVADAVLRRRFPVLKRLELQTVGVTDLASLFVLDPYLSLKLQGKPGVSAGPLCFDHAGLLLRDRVMHVLEVDGVDADIHPLRTFLTELQLIRYGSVNSVLERAQQDDLAVLSRLDLSFNPSMGTLHLTERVRWMRMLRQLVLQGNRLEKVAELVVACKPLPALHTLDLSHNWLADLSCFTEGARGSDFPSLIRLDLSHSMVCDREHVVRLFAAAHDAGAFPALQTVALEDNPTGP